MGSDTAESKSIADLRARVTMLEETVVDMLREQTAAIEAETEKLRVRQRRKPPETAEELVKRIWREAWSGKPKPKRRGSR